MLAKAGIPPMLGLHAGSWIRVALAIASLPGMTTQELT